MSRHEGVSCDSCIKGNFRGLRYKCLICYDYDLCATCFETGATSTRHTADHPMQCILTRSDYELFYGGETVNPDTPQSYSCPLCGKLGLTEVSLTEHVTADHNETPYEVLCPICAAVPGGEPNQVTDDFATHLTVEHRGGGGVHGGGLREEDLTAARGGSRRIPHPARGHSSSRTRRPNIHLTGSSGSNSNTAGSASSSSRDREREAMDPIAELLSQLSGVRRGLSAAPGSASGLGGSLGGVLGLGALGSLGGALGSLSGLGGASSSAAPSSAVPNAVGRGLLGLANRGSGANSLFSEISGISNGGSGQSQPSLERQQALRLPRRQTQVISSASTFSTPSAALGITSSSVPVSSSSTASEQNSASSESTAQSQFLLARFGNSMKDNKEVNDPNRQNRSLFIQDLLLSTLALDFELGAEEGDLEAGSGNDPANSVQRQENEPIVDSNRRESKESSEASNYESNVFGVDPSEGQQLPVTGPELTTAKTQPKMSVAISSNATKPKAIQSELKGSNAVQRRPAGGGPQPVRVSATSMSRPLLQGASLGAIVRQRAQGTGSNSAAGAANAGGVIRKPARPQASHPPPPPSSH